MKVLILSSGDRINGISAHLENSKVLAQELGYKLALDTENEIKWHLKENWDVILFTHGTGREKTSTAVPLIIKMADRYKKPKLFYLKNDYDLGENHILWVLCKQYGYTYEMITNNEYAAETRCKQFHTVWHLLNINTLLYRDHNIRWEELEPEKLIVNPVNNYGIKEFGLIYFGTPRKDRHHMFKKYFDMNWFVSTSRKNAKKYKAICDTYVINKIKREDLIRFKYSIYIEDQTSSEYYTHLANRYYECLMYDVLMFFDKSTLGTLKRACSEKMYVFDPWFIVDGKEELLAKVKYCEESLANFKNKLYIQASNKLWAKTERKEVLESIKQIIK